MIHSRSVEAKIPIDHLAPELCIDAFVLQEHMQNWWGVSRSLVQAKPGGLYCLTWKSDENSFSYISSGMVRSYKTGKRLQLDKMVYYNPTISLLGPMSIDIRITNDGVTNWLQVMQYGYQEGKDWDWYYEAVRVGWPNALKNLKEYLLSQNQE